jgi:hypothetical protein
MAREALPRRARRVVVERKKPIFVEKMGKDGEERRVRL